MIIFLISFFCVPPESEESFGQLVKMKNSLNSKTKQIRHDSFDVTKPRKAAVKQREELQKHLPKKRKPHNKSSEAKSIVSIAVMFCAINGFQRLT